MVTAIDVEETDDQKMLDMWKDWRYIRKEFFQFKKPMLDMFTQFSSMCDRHLGNIKAGKHRIELASLGVRHFNSLSYEAGPKVRIF